LTEEYWVGNDSTCRKLSARGSQISFSGRQWPRNPSGFVMGEQAGHRRFSSPLWLNFLPRAHRAVGTRQNKPLGGTKALLLPPSALGDRHYAEIIPRETGIAFPLLIDEQRQAYAIANLRSANLLHMARRDNFKSRDRAKAAGIISTNLAESFSARRELHLRAGKYRPLRPSEQTFGDNATPATLLAASIK